MCGCNLSLAVPVPHISTGLPRQMTLGMSNQVIIRIIDRSPLRFQDVIARDQEPVRSQFASRSTHRGHSMSKEAASGVGRSMRCQRPQTAADPAAVSRWIQGGPQCPGEPAECDSRVRSENSAVTSEA